MANQVLISSLGLIMSIVPVTIHGIEVLFPMQARWIANWVLPFFGLKIPNSASALTQNEQLVMLDAALELAPESKKVNAKDYLFILLFEQRQGAIGFIAVAAGAVYGLTLGLVERNPLHLVFGIVAVLMMLINANQAGWLPFFGKHPKVSSNGRSVGMVFTPFWLIVAILNYLAFTYSSI